jgi:hypothetical protein
MTDDLLTAFRSEVSLPDEATARRIYTQATGGRRRIPRRRLVLAIAVVLGAALAAGLSTTLGGASPNPDETARQHVVDRAVTEVQNAFGDQRVVSGQLYGAVLSVKLAGSDFVSGGFEARILANVVDEDLHASGLPEIDAVQSKGDGGAVYGEGVRLPATRSSLPDDACDVAPDAAPAHTTVASARMVPLLGGFCVFELETSDLAAFAQDAPVTLSKLPEMDNERPHLIEVYDDAGTLQLIQWWSPFTGAEPGDAGPLGQGEGGSRAHPGLCDPFASGGSATCG